MSRGLLERGSSMTFLRTWRECSPSKSKPSKVTVGFRVRQNSIVEQ
jgi:hypothetical protein